MGLKVPTPQGRHFLSREDTMPPEIDRLTNILSTVRQQQPIVHAISNWVTASDVASALHAVGCTPHHGLCS
jgi:hypothetical protein